MSSKSKVYFFWEVKALAINRPNKVKKTVEQIFLSEKRVLGSMHYIFCGDQRVLEINRQYLNHDFYTDIVTFDLSDDQRAVNGEAYISIERIRENAKRLGIPFDDELRRVIFHGALHLCGYKDKTKKDQKEIRAREDFYLNA